CVCLSLSLSLSLCVYVCLSVRPSVENWLNETRLAAKVSVDVSVGDCLAIKTPGGGGYGV
ncbi:MAG: hypothetical protein ACPH7G_01160, partial [Cycloclasticus pugetii]